ncbi:MAG: hypothetical protein LBT00_02025 [Spirochaetaceae bacterium]|jgi:hypothetical protein|nr:hypothetical protein [Spirochaetaceae bacterium]
MRKVVFFMLLTAATIGLNGCASLTPKTYSFAEEEGADTAAITFQGGSPSVSFVYFNDNGLPEPEEGTYWSPLTFPAGKPLDITVHAYYEQKATDSPSSGLLGSLIVLTATSVVSAATYVNIDVVFNCPPLESGKNYQLAYRRESGKHKLVLSEVATKKAVYRQEFTPK